MICVEQWGPSLPYAQATAWEPDSKIEYGWDLRRTDVAENFSPAQRPAIVGEVKRCCDLGRNILRYPIPSPGPVPDRGRGGG